MRTAGADGHAAGESATSRLDAFGSLEDTELAGLAKMAGAKKAIAKGERLWRQDGRLPSLYLLLDGWMVSTTVVGGGRDLTTKVHLPGDLLGLPSLAFSAATESVVAITAAQLRPLALHSFGHLFESHPRIAAMMFLVSQQERAALTDQLAISYTGTSLQRVATFYHRLLERMRRSQPETTDSFSLPLRRQHVADLVGISGAQLAGALKQLRSDEVLGWSGSVVTVFDSVALSKVAKAPTRQVVHDAHWFPTIDEGSDRR